MLQAVIFDLDGTIIDSEPLHTEAVLRILQERGIVLDPWELDRYIGISSSVMWSEMRIRFGLRESVEALGALQHRRNIEMLEDAGSILIPGVMELLRDIRGQRLSMAIASSSTKDYIEAVVERYSMARYFDRLVSGEEVPRGKPSPDVFLRAAVLLQVAPESCVVIEDSDNGLAAAREAGIRSVGFRNPRSGRQSLALADRIVDDIRDITVDLLRNLADSSSSA